MTISKWIFLVATIFITFALAYSLPVAIANPTTKNIIVVTALTIVMILGFITFMNAGKKKVESQTIAGQKFTPVE